MNKTVDVHSIPVKCTICQTSYGFSSADRRAIIVLVVLTGIALVLCYVSVLWYAIRTRFIPDKKALVTAETMNTNQAFDDHGDEDMEKYVQTMVNQTTTQPATFTLENEKERY